MVASVVRLIRECIWGEEGVPDNADEVSELRMRRNIFMLNPHLQVLGTTVLGEKENLFRVNLKLKSRNTWTVFRRRCSWRLVSGIILSGISGSGIS
jgi:hypothetical protein